MPFQRICAAFCVAAICLSSRGSAEPLNPIKPWILNYADEQCLASREYGAPQHPTILAFRPAGNGKSYEVFVFRTTAYPRFAQELTGSIDFGLGPIQTWLLRYHVTRSNLVAYKFRVSAEHFVQIANANSVTLTVNGGPTFYLSLQSGLDLLRGLEACTDDLQRFWNMDAAGSARTAIPAKGDVRAVFTPDDYPSEAQGRSQEGSAQFLLLVDETGRVAGCDVLISSDAPALDEVGCIVIKDRARFKPALDRDGKPIRSTVVTPSVTWRLE
jgi:TonB family protein